MDQLGERIQKDRRKVVELREEAGRLQSKADGLRRDADEVERNLDNAITANMLGR
jgi:predicted  nucleic acid-binding Zn-ribbon protein